MLDLGDRVLGYSFKLPYTSLGTLLGISPSPTSGPGSGVFLKWHRDDFRACETKLGSLCCFWAITLEVLPVINPSFMDIAI